MRAIMAEMFGKAAGCSRGRGGSMHLFDVATPLLRRQRHRRRRPAAGRGPRAGGQAAGVRASPLCFFGEGAMAEGAFHESMNLAALWQLPVLFCCENNLYAMGTALARSESQTDLCAKAASYRVPPSASTAWTCARCSRP
jgi:pyruvate dehydrogenase E1 component alpha subunit